MQQGSSVTKIVRETYKKGNLRTNTYSRPTIKALITHGNNILRYLFL